VKLYTFFRSSAAFRTRIAVNLKGIEYEHVHVDLRGPASDQRKPEFLAVNPQGLVPALVVDGTTVGQSLAIIEYLDETHPEPPLLPKGAAARAIAREMALVVCSDIHPIGNLRVLNRLIEMGIDDAARSAWSRHWIAAGFDAIEARLAQLGAGPFAFGTQPTLADICIVPQVFNARRFGLDLTPYPRIRTIEEAAHKVEAFAAAEPGRQPDAE
jgi:maleylpyruvate isomerase